MGAIRIIPCLDVKDGKVVKGVHFKNLKETGDPVKHASFYSDEGADELTFLDISATVEGRNTMIDVVKKVAEVICIPLTVGGGIRNIQDIGNLLKSGADKVSINTAAVLKPELIKESAKKFGSQCIVVAIDAKLKSKEEWEIYIEGGTKPTGISAIEWAKRVEYMGAGEILLTSIDMDGTQAGYDIELTRKVSESVKIPVIASGGAGNLQHLYDVVKKGKASAVLLASLLHFRKYSISQIKEFLNKRGIEVRI